MKWVRKHVAWIAAAAVCGFLFWLIAAAATLRATQAHAAGSLFGKAVSADRLLEQIAAVTRDGILSYGQDFSRRTPVLELQQRAWERLLLLEEARRRGISVSDEEVVEQIRGIPIFQNEDRSFDSYGYRHIIQYSLGTTPRLFEEETRQSLMIRKLLERAMGSPAVSDAEIRQEHRQSQIAIRVSALPLPDPRLAQEVAHACRQSPRQLERIAEQIKKKLVPTDFFRRTDSLAKLEWTGQDFNPLFKLEAGEVGGPLTTAKGWLVARVEEKKIPQEAEPGAEDRKRIEEALSARKKLQSYMAWYQDLLRRAKPQLRGIAQE